MTSDVAEREEQDRKRTNPVQFAREVQAEGRKVTWATRAEVTSATILVVIMAVIAGVFLFIVDFLAGNAVNWFLSLR